MSTLPRIPELEPPLPALEVVRSLYGHFLNGDVNAAVELLAPDVEWVEHFPFRGISRTRHAVAQVFLAVGSTFESYEMTFETFFHEGNEVAVRGRYRVRHPLRAQTFESPFVHLYQVYAGLVTRYEGLLDTERARQVFGVLLDTPEPHEAPATR